jgi:hypothetical protein
LETKRNLIHTVMGVLKNPPISEISFHSQPLWCVSAQHYYWLVLLY